MSDQLATASGRALLWRAVQLLLVRGISMLRTLVLARLLVPDDFGLLAIATVSVEMALSLTEFGMKPALLQRLDAERTHADTAWTIDVVRAYVVAAFLALAAPFMASAFGEPRAVNIIRVLALAPVFVASSSIGLVELERALRFRALAILGLVSSIVHAIVALALAPALGVWALVAGVLCGELSGLILSYVVAPHRLRLVLDVAAARPLFRFGRWFLVTGVVAMLAGTVLQGVISRRLGPAELGLYYLAFRIALIPNEFVSGLMHSVAFPVHARLQAETERASTAFRKSLIAMAAVQLPAYVLLLVLAPSFVESFLDPRWSGVTSVIRILAVVGIISPISDATIPMLKGRGWPQANALVLGARSIVVISLAWGFTGRSGVEGAAFAWLLGEVIAHVVCIALARWALPRPFDGVARPTAGILVACLPAALVAYLLDRWLDGAAAVLLAAAAGGLVAGIAIFWLDRRFQLGLAADVSAAWPRLGTPPASRTPSQ